MGEVPTPAELFEGNLAPNLLCVILYKGGAIGKKRAIGTAIILVTAHTETRIGPSGDQPADVAPVSVVSALDQTT